MKVYGKNQEVQIVPRGEMKYIRGKCEGVKFRITGKQKAPELNRKLKGFRVRNGADSDEGEHRLHEGENKM